MVLKNSFVENEYENKILFENLDMKNDFFNLIIMNVLNIYIQYICSSYILHIEKHFKKFVSSCKLS